MPVKTLAMRRFKGQMRTFYCDEHGGFQHEYVDFYPAKLVESVVEGLANQVLEERKKNNSMFDQFQARRKKLRDSRHAAVSEKDRYLKALRLLVDHDLIPDCPYKSVILNLVKDATNEEKCL